MHFCIDKPRNTIYNTYKFKRPVRPYLPIRRRPSEERGFPLRISAKGRYALAAAIHMAENYESGETLTVFSISDKLGISKIYLEQVFSLLKRGGVVSSVKGAQGGYFLARSPARITAYDLLSAVELSLFEKADDLASSKAPEMDKAIQSAVFAVLDETIEETLSKITLADLVDAAERERQGGGIMFYI